MTSTIKIKIMLVGYNRPNHFFRVFDEVCKQTNLPIEILLDAPLSEQVTELQNMIRSEVLKKNRPNLNIYSFDEHQGVRKSICTAVERALSDADAVIVLEDDCVPINGFFDFMVENLNQYSDNKDIRSLCGYLPPQCVTATTNVISRRFIPWGWATWRDRWNKDTNLVTLPAIKLPKDLELVVSDLSSMEEQSDIWSWRWSLKHYFTNTKVLYPPYTLIENIGFDGTGVHCGQTGVFNRLDPEFDGGRSSNCFLEDSGEHDLIEEFMERYSAEATFGKRDAYSDNQSREQS
jgi:hypothetical protein